MLAWMSRRHRLRRRKPDVRKIYSSCLKKDCALSHFNYRYKSTVKLPYCNSHSSRFDPSFRITHNELTKASAGSVMSNPKQSLVLMLAEKRFILQIMCLLGKFCLRFKRGSLAEVVTQSIGVEAEKLKSRWKKVRSSRSRCNNKSINQPCPCLYGDRIH